MDPKDSSSSSSSTRPKMKFTPKPLRNRVVPTPQPPPPQPEDQHLLHRRWNDLGRREPKVERNSSVQVAFGPGASSSPNLGTFGVTKGSDKRSGTASKDFSSEQNSLECSITAVKDQLDTCMIDAAYDTTNASSVAKIKKEYKEPWDYQHSNYPTTLPLRKPYSGDPEILDEEEFGEAASNVMYNESTINPAAELGLSEKSEQSRMLLFQLPPLPLVKQPVSMKGKEKVGASRISQESTKGGAWEELPGGYMGKMLVYKSGAVKFKVGETLLDVSPGSNSEFPQDVVIMNTAQKHCCVIGEISKMAVVTPDLDSVETLEDPS